METKYLKKLFAYFLIIVPLTVVFAQGKLVLFGIPWYVPEILIMSAFGALLFFERMFFLRWRRGIFFFALALMMGGLLLATISNDISLHGYGRMKSWFFFPLLYGCMLSFALQKKMISLQGILWSMFAGGIVIGFSTLLSIVSGGGFSYDHRLHGFFSSPNHLAMLLGTALLSGIFLVVSLWEKQGKEKVYLFSGAIFLLALLLLTQSYAVIFSLMIALGLRLSAYGKNLSWKKSLALLLGGMVCIGIVFSLNSGKWQDITTGSDRSSLASRTMIWHAALRMIRDHPFVGIGPGNFQEQYLAYQQYFPPYLEWSAPHPHNMFLDIWLEGGLLAFIGFVMFFLSWLLSSARHFWQKKNESSLKVLPFLFALYFFGIGMIDVPFLRNDLAYFFVTAFVISRYEMTRDFYREI